MPEEQTALDEFFEEIKKSKISPFLKKHDISEEKKESQFKVTCVIPSPELEEQMKKSLQVCEEKKGQISSEADCSQKTEQKYS